MKIKKNVPIDKAEKQGSTRQKHIFVNMAVGDVIDIKDKKTWPKISKYVHTVASKKKWVVRTIWLKENKLGRIRRVS